MSFQHFRLSEAVTPLPAHLQPQVAVAPSPTNSVQQFQTVNTNNTFPTNNVAVGQTSSTKAPYGSGDTDDGYTLVFPSLDDFHEWRNKEEETQMVEFVKGDTHQSKAVPPRFKDHTKLVCARHSRSGRKKYVKKHPERVRKVPSRKLDGEGCSASISFKTYYDTEEVRACYISQHSHEIGLANLPFTRRGRKAAVQQEKSRKQPKLTHPSSVSSPSGSQPPPVASTSRAQTTEQFSNCDLYASATTSSPGYVSPTDHLPIRDTGRCSVGFAILFRTTAWENMATLFESVRGHARTFDYPTASVACVGDGTHPIIFGESCYDGGACHGSPVARCAGP
ncbi:hypothetical protein DFH06DRAFT_1475733 [Mycena polygramma]|nr:hypothetical protein DFH06DRAFT_1475733 [Mycena polygramma]